MGRQKKMSPDQLQAVLNNARLNLLTAQKGGQLFGFCETFQHTIAEIEILYFGLTPEMQGKGFGPKFLCWILETLWSDDIKRIWLHTDTNDHPKAIDTYLNAGSKFMIERWKISRTEGNPKLDK